VTVAFNYGEYNLSHYLVYQTWVYADTVKTWTYDGAGQNYVEDKVITAYGNPAHALPTQVTYYTSDGGVKVQNNFYPLDLSLSGNPETARQALLARQMSPVLQQTVTKNNTPVFALNTFYNLFPNGLVLPQIKQVQIASNPIESRIQFNNYDYKGNILDENKVSDTHISYQWGYNSLYPVAEVKNAKVNDIFFDSFEEGDGNSASGNSKTGHYSHTGGYSKTLIGLDAGNYILSYWQLSGPDWTLVTTPVTVTGSSYTLSISGQIDDVRFYPATAQMTTYTYDTLIGMTSSTDAKGEVTYYEYDGFQRLMNVRDKDKNVIKHIDYHYQAH
jgi:YD repeat-containing protein